MPQYNLYYAGADGFLSQVSYFFLAYGGLGIWIFIAWHQVAMFMATMDRGLAVGQSGSWREVFLTSCFGLSAVLFLQDLAPCLSPLSLNRKLSSHLERLQTQAIKKQTDLCICESSQLIFHGERINKTSCN